MIEGAVVVAAEAAGAKAITRAATPENAVAAATAATVERRTIRRELLAPRRELRKHNDDSDKADHTVAPPLRTPK